MRVTFVNRYFFPDHAATSQLLADLAFHLTAHGHAVTVITSRQRLDDPRALLAARETVRGVTVRRLGGSRRGRATLGGRALDYLSFHLGALWHLWLVTRAGDVVVAKTDPPLISVTVALVARLRGAAQVNWLHDLFPEIATALRVPGTGGVAGALLRRLRDASLSAARANVAIGDTMARRLAERRIGRVRVIHNWADGEALAPREGAGSDLRARWDLEGRFVVMYSGNLGRVHEHRCLLDAAVRLAGDDRIAFVVIGGGARRSEAMAYARGQGLTRVRFEPYQPRETLNESLQVADVHVVTLRPSLEGLVVPSKLYGAMASGRAVLVVGDVDGEAARIVREAGCGLAFAPGEAGALAGAIDALARDPERTRRLGRAARTAFERRYSDRLALAAWEHTLGEAARGPVPAA